MSKQPIPPPIDRRQEPTPAPFGKVNVPKPAWRELVAPYAGGPRAPTIGSHLKYSPGWIWADWHVCRCNKAIPLYPCIIRFGLEIELPALRLKLRCQTCKEPPSSLTCPTFGRHDEYRFPPMERVPEALKAYARIDPRHWPAPLRGRGLFDEIGYDYPPGPPGHGCTSVTQPHAWRDILDLTPEGFS